MMHVNLTRTSIDGAVSRIIEEVGGDFVYHAPEQNSDEPEGHNDDCVYVYKGKPSCLIARVLHEHFGVPLGAFVENSSASELLGILAEKGRRRVVGFTIEWGAGVPGYLNTLQASQDEEIPYKYLPRIGDAYWRGWRDAWTQP